MSEDDFQSPRALARFILREAVFGSLATEGEKGYPNASVVGVASLPDGAPVVLLASASKTAADVRKDPRVSLVIPEKPLAADPLSVSRLTVTGLMQPMEKDAIRSRYLMRHPEAIKHGDFAMFGFWRIAIERAYLVAPLGKTTDLTAQDLIGGGSTPGGKNDSNLSA